MMPDPNTETSPQGMSSPVIRCVFFAVIISLAAMLAAALRPGLVVGDTVTSRLATVYALTHDGTWRIDRPVNLAPNPFEPLCVDKVVVNGRLVSSKPPLLPLLMTGEYMLLRSVTGLDLDNRSDLRPILNFMVLTLCQASFAIGMAFFAATVSLFVRNPLRAAIPLVLLGFASPLPGYAQQLNNHTPAAAALMAALYFALALGTGKRAPKAWRFAAFGFCSALVFAMDMPVVIYTALAAAWLAWRFPRQALLWAPVGAALPLLAHFGGLWLATGDLRPVQMRGGTYLYESSYWRNPLGIDALNEPKLVYLFHITFGRLGLFLLFPALLASVWGTGKVLRSGPAGLRLPVALAACAFLVLTAYYVKSTNNYGGASYGFRWYLGSVPVLLLLGAPLFDRLRSPLGWVAMACAAAVSAYSAWECLQAPWGTGNEWTCRLLFGPVV